MTGKEIVLLEARMLILGLRLQDARSAGSNYHIVNAEDASECLAQYETIEQVRQYVDGFQKATDLCSRQPLLTFQGAPLVWDHEREREEIRRLERENRALRGHLERIASEEYTLSHGRPGTCGCPTAARRALHRLKNDTEWSKWYGEMYEKKHGHPPPETPAEQADSASTHTPSTLCRLTKDLCDRIQRFHYGMSFEDRGRAEWQSVMTLKCEIDRRLEPLLGKPRHETAQEQADPGFQGDHDTGV